MVADVQSWLDNPGGNFGWFMIGDESSFPTAKAWGSSNNTDPALQPMLEIEYTIPGPSGLAVVAVGLLAGRRRRRHV